MIVSYKYKLYRSKKNKHIHSLLNVAGNIWNHSLALQKRYYALYGKYIDVNRMQKHIAKVRNNNPAWKMLHSQSVQEILQRQDASFQRFFKHQQKRPPKFKKSTLFSSFLFKQGGYKLEGNTITINAIKRSFKFSFSRHYGTPKTIRLYRNRLGEIFLVITNEMALEGIFKQHNHSKNAGKSTAVGIDFGLKQYLTFSDESDPVKQPLFFKQSLDAIKKANKALSRKQRGSKNRGKAKGVLARQHLKVKNCRSDWQWKLAHELCKKYDFIAIEDLNMKAMQMMWGRKVSDYGHASFLHVLKHVAIKYGVRVHEIDRWYPSSKECYCCRNIKTRLNLNEREYECEECGYIEDRDTNAAKNILRQGIVEYKSQSKTELAPHLALAL